MYQRTVNLKVNEILSYIVLVFYGLYPLWYIPGTGIAVKFLFLNLFLCVALFFYWQPFFRAKELPVTIDTGKIWSRENATLAGMAVFAACLHLVFWILPVKTGEDMQSHISPAAGFVYYIFRENDPLLVRLILVSVAVALIYLAGRIKKSRPVLFWGLLIGLMNLYCFILARGRVIENMGLPYTIFRYPPVPKLLVAAGFMVTGINEVSPRVIQYAFIIGLAFVMVKLVGLVRPKVAVKTVFLSTLLFPTFFYFSNDCLIECGTIFFFAVVSYCFLLSLKDDKYILPAMIWLSLGMLYKQLILGQLIIIALYLVFLRWSGKIDHATFKKHCKYLLIPVVIGGPFLILGAFLMVRGLYIYPDPLKAGLNFINMSKTLGPVLTLLLAVATAYCLIRKEKNNWYWLILIISYYLMIGLTEANGFIRHAQPFYLGIFYFFAVFLSDLELLAGQRQRLLGLALTLGLTLLMVDSNLFRENAWQRETLLNRYQNIVPYVQLMEFVKEHPEAGTKIYAPLETEPSHFYLAKYHLKRTIHWDRKMFKGLPFDQTVDHYFENDFDLLFLPYASITDVGNFIPLVDQILWSRKFQIVKIFQEHNNCAVLLKKRK